MSNFASQFTELESENARLRKELEVSGTAEERIGKANQLAEEAWQQNEDLKKELSETKAKLEEATKLREQEELAAEETAKRLLKSIESLLGECFSSCLVFAFADEYVVTPLYLCSSCCRCTY